MRSILRSLLFLLALTSAFVGGRPLAAADQIIAPAATEFTGGQPLVLFLGDNPYADQTCGLLLYDAYARLVGVRWLPPVAPPDPLAAMEEEIPFRPCGRFWFRTDGLAAGPLTVKFVTRETVDGADQCRVRQSFTVNLKPAASTPPPLATDTLSLWTPDRPVRFWRSTPLAVAAKNDWEKLLTDTRLSGGSAPCDGPILVLPRGTVLSSRLIAEEIDPVLRSRGLVICETWPTPSLDDAIDLSTIVSPTAPIVKLPDIRPIQAFTGLTGPAIPSDPDPADWLDRDRQSRLLARRDPGHHRLYGLVEQSFCVLTTRLEPTPGTQVLRYAADGSPAVTLRTLPAGGAVLVLNAAVEGYAAAAQKPAAAVDFLGVDAGYARRLLTGLHGGAALRDALAQVRDLLAARREQIGETGPYFSLRADLRQDTDRCLFLVADVLTTTRSLPNWTPPAAIAVHLLRNGEPQQEAVMALHDRQYLQTFRLPLDAPADGWSVTLNDPFTGEPLNFPAALPAALELTVVDTPAP